MISALSTRQLRTILFPPLIPGTNGSQACTMWNPEPTAESMFRVLVRRVCGSQSMLTGQAVTNVKGCLLHQQALSLPLWPPLPASWPFSLCHSSCCWSTNRGSITGPADVSIGDTNTPTNKHTQIVHPHAASTTKLAYCARTLPVTLVVLEENPFTRCMSCSSVIQFTHNGPFPLSSLLPRCTRAGSNGQVSLPTVLQPAGPPFTHTCTCTHTHLHTLQRMQDV